MNKTPPDFIISVLQDHPSRLEKEAIILAQAEEGNDIFFKGVRAALDPMTTFGLKQVPEKTDESGNRLDWVDFASVADRLVSRQLTGNAARDAVKELMDQTTKSLWNNWYRRILIKDLRCGMSEKTVNKVVEKKWPQYSVPVFSCQLAHDSANHEGKVSGKKLLEVKLDGVRVITIVRTDGRVDMFSRNGKELANFPHVIEQISEVVKKTPPPYDLVLDGEIMSSSFQDLMTQVHRKSDVKANDAVLNLFDFIPLTDFEQGRWDRTQLIRSQMVQAWVSTNHADMPNVKCLVFESVDLNSLEGQLRFKEINSQAINGGYEGIMIKDPDAPYECKRSHAWLKLKPFIEATLEIVDVEEGTGKNVGRLGAFVCRGTDDGKTISVNVGSGFTDDDRIKFWADRTVLVGNLVEVRADAITMNQDGTYSLRFPRFLKFRGFLPGEKI